MPSSAVYRTLSALKCFIRHRWWTNQVNVKDHNGCEFVLAWKQCERCAASKLIHILR